MRNIDKLARVHIRNRKWKGGRDREKDPRKKGDKERETNLRKKEKGGRRKETDLRKKGERWEGKINRSG